MNTTIKFNPKVYQGKPRVYVSVPRASRISRLWVWEESSQEYVSPPRGKCYMVKRYETNSFGVRKRRVQFFASLEEARDWQAGGTLETTNDEEVIETGHVTTSRTFQEVVEEWKHRCYPRMAESTRVRYDNLLELYFGSLMTVPIDEVTPKVVDAWLDELKDPNHWTMRSKKRQSFDHELSLLSTILKYYVNYNDDSAFQFPIKQRHKDGVWLNRTRKVVSKHLPEGEFLKFREELLKQAEGMMLAVLASVQYYQVLRISEAAALYWEDVQLDWATPHNSRVRIVRSITWLRQKGLPSFIKVGFKNADANQGIKDDLPSANQNRGGRI
jgi:hypothetical protein